MLRLLHWSRLCSDARNGCTLNGVSRCIGLGAHCSAPESWCLHQASVGSHTWGPANIQSRGAPFMCTAVVWLSCIARLCGCHGFVRLVWPCCVSLRLFHLNRLCSDARKGCTLKGVSRCIGLGAQCSAPESWCLHEASVGSHTWALLTSKVAVRHSCAQQSFGLRVSRGCAGKRCSSPARAPGSSIRQIAHIIYIYIYIYAREICLFLCMCASI